MKKSTLLKLLLTVTAAGALSLYGQTSGIGTTTSLKCPADCDHLTCGDGQRAHCNSKGQCVCP